MKISFASSVPEHGVVCLGVRQDRQLTPWGKNLHKNNTYLEKSLKQTHFCGKPKEVLSLLAPWGTNWDRIVLFGLGSETLEPAMACEVGGTLVKHLLETPHHEAFIVSDDLDLETIVQMAFGALLRAWRFDKYRTSLKTEEKFTLEHLIFYVPDSKQAEAKERLKICEATVAGVHWTRDLVSEPGNVINPQTFAQQAKTLQDLGVEVEILDEPVLKKMGMNALLGVGRGSDTPPCLIVLQWKNHAQDKPIALVGKGVTFDSGGISIKPSLKMDEMKGDMAGAAVILGLFRAIALAKISVPVVGILACVENMPSGKAQRPGDIVRSLSGQTIEVLNTDAEGRLILADALWYAQDRFHPQYMVDLATLTGAMQIALGSEYAGLFSNHDHLSDQLKKAGDIVDEKLWRLPLGAAYDEAVRSGTVADMTNIPPVGFGAGSIMGGQFLARFVNDIPWAHLDIASVSMMNQDSELYPKGATGFGVRLLMQWLHNYKAA